MNDIFALIIVLLTAGTGIVWLADAILRRVVYRRREKTFPSGWRWLVDTCRGFFPLVLAILIVRSFVAEPFHIPSGSMMPSVLIGDYVVTEKFAYGLRLPLSHTKVVPTGSVHRGDVAVFRFPRNPSVDFIKRVIGLPGDTITYTCTGNELIINGKKVKRKRLGVYPGEGAMEVARGAQLWMEWLPRNGGGTVKHRILIRPDRPTRCGTWKVPPHSYFVMGDNRDNSDDSRYWGFVPEKNLVGKAVLVFFNFQGWTHWPLWHRIGTLLR